MWSSRSEAAQEARRRVWVGALANIPAPLRGANHLPAS
jgi:hypothetical protein